MKPGLVALIESFKKENNEKQNIAKQKQATNNSKIENAYNVVKEESTIIDFSYEPYPRGEYTPKRSAYSQLKDYFNYGTTTTGVVELENNCYVTNVRVRTRD